MSVLRMVTLRICWNGMLMPASFERLGLSSRGGRAPAAYLTQRPAQPRGSNLSSMSAEAFIALAVKSSRQVKRKRTNHSPNCFSQPRSLNPKS